jgi:hypothetical protein
MATLRPSSAVSNRNVPDRAPDVNQTSSGEAATQSIGDSPPSTISFDEASPGPGGRYLPTSPVIEISDDEDGPSTVSQARLRNHDQIEDAITTSPTLREPRESPVNLTSLVVSVNLSTLVRFLLTINRIGI